VNTWVRFGDGTGTWPFAEGERNQDVPGWDIRQERDRSKHVSMSSHRVSVDGVSACGWIPNIRLTIILSTRRAATSHRPRFGRLRSFPLSDVLVITRALLKVPVSTMMSPSVPVSFDNEWWEGHRILLGRVPTDALRWDMSVGLMATRPATVSRMEHERPNSRRNPAISAASVVGAREFNLRPLGPRDTMQILCGMFTLRGGASLSAEAVLGLVVPARVIGLCLAERGAPRTAVASAYDACDQHRIVLRSDFKLAPSSWDRTVLGIVPGHTLAAARAPVRRNSRYPRLSHLHNTTV
jgi:hypothetical protein